MEREEKIRSYRGSDKDQVYSLILSIFQYEYRDIPPDKYLDDLNNMDKIYRGDQNGFWVFEENEKIVGTIALKQDEKEVALLRRFFVNPNFRRRGVGKLLLAHVLAFAKAKNYKKVIFIGNFQMKLVKEVLMRHSFREDEVFLFEDFPFFKLSYSF